MHLLRVFPDHLAASSASHVLLARGGDAAIFSAINLGRRAKLQLSLLTSFPYVDG